MNKSRISGKNYTFVENVPSIDGKEFFVLCHDESGNKFFCQPDQWEAGVIQDSLPNGFQPTVRGSSTTQEKLELFLSLFRGREDVCAKGYFRKDGGVGYTPFCGNEWSKGICRKPKVKCAECTNRKFIPLSANIVRDHLVGRTLVGSYPMRPDDTTWFLVLDFDEEDWQQNVSAFRETCKYYNIIPAVERSRSGNGAHIWFFFEQPVAAKEARRFGSGLLTKTMSNRHELDFASYDRMFPSQDTMPKGGFGNLIVLPFQGNAQKNGNSLFIDENFIPYADQWAFLSGLPRITENELIVWNQKLNTQSDLGLLAAADEDAPWESPKPAADLQQEDFPQRLNLVLSNMLYIPKAGLSDKAIDRFKRLAAFRNPIFARNQAMRLPVQNIPRIIDCSELYSNHLGLPRGCMNEVAEILNDHFVPFSIDDKRNTGNPIPVSFIGELRPEQISAAEALLTNEIGVLSATTAFGKTVIAAWLIGQRQVNTLVLVSSSALLTQWKSALEKFLNFDAIPQPEQPKKRGRKKKFSAIGLLGSGKDSLNGIVDIAIIQSLFEGDEKNVKDLVRSYGMVICDECHHVAAFSFEKIMKSVTAKYIYGLSATPKRQDGHDPIIFMQCGPIRYLVDPRSQALKHGFEHFIIPRFTKTRIEDKEAIQSIYSELYQNDARNEMIVRDVLNAYEKGRTPILLTERKEHAELLAAKLVFHTENLFLLIGSDSVKEKREKLEQLHSLSTEDRFIIVATGKYIGEGFDEPRLDTLFLCMPIAWKGTLAQYAGRLHRNYDGKRDVQVWDYVDLNIPVLERMYHKRLKGYSDLGYRVQNYSGLEDPGMIYGNPIYKKVFDNDLTSFRHETIISCPVLIPAKLKPLISLLQTNEISNMFLITQPVEAYKTEQQDQIRSMLEVISENGCQVLFEENEKKRFAIFDRRIVWYGNISFYGFTPKDAAVLRLENTDLAGELVKPYTLQSTAYFSSDDPPKLF